MESHVDSNSPDGFRSTCQALIYEKESCKLEHPAFDLQVLHLLLHCHNLQDIIS